MLAGRAAFSHASLSAAASPGAPPPLSTPERAYPPDVEQAVVRGLSPDREERWPDVAAYVAALETALGPVADDVAEPWLPLDPHLTQLGAPPSIKVDESPLAEPTPPRRRRWRWAGGAVAAAVVLVASAAGGYAVAQRTDPKV